MPFFVDRSSSQIFLISLSLAASGLTHLALGEVINFTAALHDPENLIKFVKVTPCAAEDQQAAVKNNLKNVVEFSLICTQN